jgi:hypothetical protein
MARRWSELVEASRLVFGLAWEALQIGNIAGGTVVSAVGGAPTRADSERRRTSTRAGTLATSERK